MNKRKSDKSRFIAEADGFVNLTGAELAEWERKREKRLQQRFGERRKQRKQQNNPQPPENIESDLQE